MKVYIGADHAGFKLKEYIKKYLKLYLLGGTINGGRSVNSSLSRLGSHETTTDWVN